MLAPALRRSRSTRCLCIRTSFHTAHAQSGALATPRLHPPRKGRPLGPSQSNSSGSPNQRAQQRRHNPTRAALGNMVTLCLNLPNPLCLLGRRDSGPSCIQIPRIAIYDSRPRDIGSIFSSGDVSSYSETIYIDRFASVDIRVRCQRPCAKTDA